MREGEREREKERERERERERSTAYTCKHGQRDGKRRTMQWQTKRANSRKIGGLQMT